MRRIKIKNMKLKTKVALVYSIFVIAVGVAVLLFLYFTVQESLVNNPALNKIAPGSFQIIVRKVVGENNFVEYFNGGFYPYSQSSLTSSQFNNLLSSDILKRIEIISAIAIAFILLSAFLVSYFLSKVLLKPVTDIANETSKFDIENINLRLEAPNTDDEVKKLVGSFNHTLDRIQGSFYDLEQFNAFATHELKNALAVMKTKLEVDYRTGDYKQALDFAISYVDSVSETVNDVLTISSRQSGSSIEPVDLALAAAQTVDDYSMICENITLETPDEGVPPVAGREIWLRRAISNMIDNAVKISPEGFPVRVEVKQVFEAVIVSVSDSGRGIDEGKLDFIWEPYYSSSSQNNSYGLGLAMVKHVAEICNGVVWAEGNQNGGSTFYLSFPVMESIASHS